ncbi:MULTISPECIES: redoxin domain-containing protein [unclassified Arcicella]|uniref:redoxin domain-containing protein n=1 Tax=unclassified Arcicella TaxID=2644986 RepID=UPI002866BA38|nr:MULTISPECIES: redoxin domain-containing protein [unclassified Arcicella]MDR6562033.1 peroxiredoxin [Arcicella sp. BE51]MDR6811905.1 peroxiredoxin [Arcicella sp. BE140]MDR6822935.1 peroxiredoxin [Arcicella sp. BE139]
MQEPIDKKRPKALQASNFAPNFWLIKEMGRWSNLPKNIENQPNFTLNELMLFRPLVLSFFSPSWNNYGEIHLELLQKAHKRLKNIGAEILVMTDVLPEKLDALANEYKLGFNICHDRNNEIAELLGVYSKDYPIWQRITGISNEVPLPATFIIVPNLLIIYSFVDDDFESIFSIKEMEAFIKLYRNK